ncbi:hypothetical protein BTS2_1948 [Bacillus sp. TS-2]|nr:hypothetical protein BTS2_1948 [Bacillus sp. TS-2]
MKRMLVLGIILSAIVLVLPTMLVLMGSSNEEVLQTDHNVEASTEKEQSHESEEVVLEKASADDVMVTVFRTEKNEVEEIKLEEYVMGVVGSEMNASFEMEALKAQALAARTFILQYMMNEEVTKTPEGALITDTGATHQVYQDKTQLQEKWGEQFDEYYRKIQEAVLSTKGEIITYGEKPIDASYFSTSNGYTENSEDYWENKLPYLRSVESPWDQESPRFTGQTTISVEDFEAKLNVELPNDGSVGTIVSRTNSGRVETANINGKELSGKVIRESLSLDSADFQWQRQGNEVIVQTKGWGHGVGMSQYGANGMALEGKSYKEIVHHYYQDVKIETTAPFIKQYVANRS